MENGKQENGKRETGNGKTGNGKREMEYDYTVIIKNRKADINPL